VGLYKLDALASVRVARIVPDEPCGQQPLVSYAVMSLNAGAIVGYLSFAPMAERLGRRGAFLVMLLGSAAILPITFLGVSTYLAVLLLLPILGFFSNGIFSGFPIYLPELYPTQYRATEPASASMWDGSWPRLDFPDRLLGNPTRHVAPRGGLCCYRLLDGYSYLAGARETKGKELE